MQHITYIWESLRPTQWSKNVFIFAGILFSQHFFEISMLAKVFAAFIVFCLLSGAVYTLNDIADLEQDRRHPIKRRRPLASGRLRVRTGAAAAVLIGIAALVVSYFLSTAFFKVSLMYVALQIAYSFFLKRIVILDVFSIASGFVLRVVAGALVVDVMISSWLIICTILLSLFLGFCKRRHELVLIGDEAPNQRQVLGEYSPRLLDQMIAVVTASTVVAYGLYTMSPETVTKFGTKNLVLTIPFVLYGIFRYLYLVYHTESGGDPAKTLISDLPIVVTVLLWAVFCGIVILFGESILKVIS